MTRGVSTTVGLAGALALGLASCDGHVRTTRQGEREDEQVSTQATLHLSREASLLEQGRQAAAQGRYDEAVADFEAVQGSASAKPEQREEALYQLGSVHANGLNPKRDPDRAISYFERFLVEFPKSARRTAAEQMLAGLRGAAR